MKFTRKSFLQMVSAMPALPWARGERVCAGIPAVPSAPVEVSPWLREWMSRPRIPVLESTDSKAVWLIEAALKGENVEFRYEGGNEPGLERKVSPGFVFRVEDSEALYVAGYCHRREAERIFRLDRIKVVKAIP